MRPSPHRRPKRFKPQSITDLFCFSWRAAFQSRLKTTTKRCGHSSPAKIAQPVRMRFQFKPNSCSLCEKMSFQHKLQYVYHWQKGQSDGKTLHKSDLQRQKGRAKKQTGCSSGRGPGVGLRRPLNLLDHWASHFTSLALLLPHPLSVWPE